MLRYQRRMRSALTRVVLVTLFALPMAATSASAGTPCPQGASVRYVRQCSPPNQVQCSDSNNGMQPNTAWATLKRAASALNGPGTGVDTIIVGPGVYREGDIALLLRTGLTKSFIADQTGRCTSDVAGAVRVDVGMTVDTGFLILGATNVVVSGFEITNATVAGIQVKPNTFNQRPVTITLANNLIYENGADDRSRGIDVQDAEGVTIFNNLVYRNAGNGIGVLSAPRSKVINNTIYGHPRYGVVIAQQPVATTATPTPTPTGGATTPTPSPTASTSPTTTPGPSSGSWLLNNIIAGNATGAAIAFSVDVDRMSGCDYIGAFNLISAPAGREYSAETPRDLSDIRTEADFVDAANDDFRLDPSSNAIDAGSESAGRLHLQNGSTREDGGRDMGRVDLGYHFDSATIPVFDDVPATTQEVFVRPDGDDGQDGSQPEQAVRTISAAIDRARAVSRIIVAPGVYRETLAIDAGRPAGPIELFADPQGALTDLEPGRVVVDAHRAGAGINVIEHCSTVIDGFVVMNGAADGIRLKSAHGSIVRNNVTHSNSGRGINVVDTDEAMIFNNLSYANVGGIQIGGNDLGSQRAIVQNNTVYGNQADGILIGTGPMASTGAHVLYNIIDDNGQSGLQLDDNNRAGRSVVGFCAEYNVVFHPDMTRRYGPIRNENCDQCLTPTPVATEGACAASMCMPTESGCFLNPPTDRQLDPSFVRPVAGEDGCVGGRRFWDDSFWLSRVLMSPAIDLGWAPPPAERVRAESVDLDDLVTESCDERDREWLDAGYHAPRQCFTDLPPLAGDCNADNCVTVGEVVTGVNIVLDRRPLSACPAFDLNASGSVTVDELVSAVNDLFCCTGVPAAP